MKANLHIKRLYMFALFLQRWELIEQMFRTRQQFYCMEDNTGVRHFHWALKGLPKIFPRHWRTNAMGFPYLELMPTLNSLGAAAYFFDLQGDELFALLVPEHAYHPYNLRKLPHCARPGDVAQQVYIFMIQKQKELGNEGTATKD
jgi:hypothetical protein